MTSLNYLGLDQSVLGTRNEDEALHFHKICEFSGIEFPDGDSVRLLVMRCNELTKVSDEW